MSTVGVPRRKLAVPAVLLSALMLVGCGGHATGVLIPVAESAPGASVTDLLVITTRKPSGNPATLYGGERDKNFSLDDIKVSIPPSSQRKAGEVAWPRRLPPDPARDFATVEVNRLEPNRQAGFAWLRENLPKNRDVLVFVHGFNNTYEDAVFRFAQIVHDSKVDAAPILFTWPSGASVFDYNYDRESTIYSRDGLETVLRLLADSPQVHEVTVLAHSMGTWLAMESLRQMAIRDGRVAPKIRNVILASPDIDIDVFARQFRDLGDKRPRFTVFVSQDDKALAVSRLVAGNVNRLGQIDPNVEPYRSAAQRAGITVVDLTRLKAGDSLNHDKFASSPQIAQAIGTRLAAGQTLTDSEVGLGDNISILAAGTAKAVGTGVGLAVSTPLSVVDEKTRRNLSRQAGTLSEQAGTSAVDTGKKGHSAADELLTPTEEEKE